MSQFSTITTAAIISSALSAVAVYFVVSHFIMEAWREEAEFRLGFVEIESTRDSISAEMQLLNAIAIVESVKAGETENLLSLACTALTFSLPNVKSILYKDAPHRKEEIEAMVSEGRALLEKLRLEGVCLTSP